MKLDIPGHGPAFVYTANRPLDRKAPALVFIHGAQNDHSVWAMQSRYLAHHGYRVLAVDLPGHGASARPLLTTIDAMADWIDGLLQAADVDEATLIGHSMGSLVALACAHRHRARVRAIALVGSVAPMPVSDALLQAAQGDEARAITMILNWSHSGLTNWPAPGFSTFVMSRRLMERQPAGTLYNDLSACNAWQAGLQAASGTICPAIVVSGAQDQMTPPRAAAGLVAVLRDRRDIGDAVPTRHEVIARCGHNIMAEQPERLLAILKGFLASLDAVKAA